MAYSKADICMQNKFLKTKIKDGRDKMTDKMLTKNHLVLEWMLNLSLETCMILDNQCSFYVGFFLIAYHQLYICRTGVSMRNDEEYSSWYIVIWGVLLIKELTGMYLP